MDTTISHLDPTISDRLLAIIAREGLVERDKLSMDASLDSLGVESADVVVILLAIEDEFGVYIPIDSELSDVATVGDLVNALATQIAAKQAST